MYRVLVPVQVLDEGANAALVLEAVLLVVALVGEGDEDAPVEEAELAEALGEDVEGAECPAARPRLGPPESGTHV